MEFQPTTPPSDPEAFLPVVDMLRSAGINREASHILRGARDFRGCLIANGLPMFQVALLSQQDWRPRRRYWVARVDLFCAWLSHRKMLTGYQLASGKVIPLPARNSPLRKMLRPEWVRANVKHTKTTKRLAECLRDPSKQGSIEWRTPRLAP